MSAPYQLPADLAAQPLGVSWTTLGALATLKPTAQQNQATIDTIARQASSLADGEAGQNIRAGLMTETNYAPGHRVGILPNGLARFITSRNPILRVVQAQVAAANQVPNTTWTQLPPGAAYPQQEVFGIYDSSAPGGATGGGQSILISGAYVNRCLGRMGTRVQVSYLSGWPHTQLVSDAVADAGILDVEDVTAWSGASGLILDGANTEVVNVGVTAAASAQAYNPAANYFTTGVVVSESGANYACLVQNGPLTAVGAIAPGSNPGVWMPNPEPAGPGTLSLLSPLQFDHTAPVLVTATPGSLRWAVALLAKAEALERGVATITIDSAESSSGGLGGAISSARQEAAIIIRDLCRVY